jgi:pyruvate,water dikinase
MKERDLQLKTLTERAKELECLYAVDELLQDKQLSLPAVMTRLLQIIPLGFTDSSACRVRIRFRSDIYGAEDSDGVLMLHCADVYAGEEAVGAIEVGYTKTSGHRAGDLLEDEIKLLEVIARRVSQMVLSTQREIGLLVHMLQQINPDALKYICEKLYVHLKQIGQDGALPAPAGAKEQQTYGETNIPLKMDAGLDANALSKNIIDSAVACLPRGDVFRLINKWAQEERMFALVKAVDDPTATIDDVRAAVDKYVEAAGANGASAEISQTESWLTAELCHRFLTANGHLLNLVLDNIHIADFSLVLGRIIGLETSRGNIGGKGAGLFIAEQILKHAAKEEPLLRGIKTPRTWYIATDQLSEFLSYNNMKDLNAYKYNSAFYLRAAYDDVVSKIKSAKLPPGITNRLLIALDDLEGAPIIVRSSSLLEDSHEGAFSGKYKSLFLANQGSKEQRLAALEDAILEVYSSMYNPDSISYRKERGLINYTERMGILIQQVVGRKIGKYYMPIYAGVAFSHNLFRWSTRISSDGGLVRLVMGLGTRAVDRVNDDYPVLFSPEKPQLRVNQTPDGIRHYAPNRVDLINLQTNSFETVETSSLFKTFGDEIPDLYRYVSVYNSNMIENKNAYTLDAQNDEIVVTFDTVLMAGDLPRRLKRMLDVLKEKMDTPVDIEFAFDGDDLYLLQCRPQGEGALRSPAPIPQNLDGKDIVFTANKYISDGAISGITHVVYIDGDAYNRLATREDLLLVGRVVGLLNESLPRRKFILIGPGRWGSRGDIRLGVRVTYSDICHTAALLEVAWEKAAYVPALSFGTHFFQDLVEADIVYIPLYPNQPGAIFRESFFKGSGNILAKMFPEYAHLSDVVKVIDVPAESFSKTLAIRLNSDLEQAVAFLSDEKSGHSGKQRVKKPGQTSWAITKDREHWQWRYYMAKQIAENIDVREMGVKGVYLFGSTNAGNSGIGSDIDLILHVDGDDKQRLLLKSWLDGWSQALAKINFLHTGYDAGKLLDFHLVTDRDIADRDPYASKIVSVMDPAERLR